MEFFCVECSQKLDKIESLTVGCVGIHECVSCGRKIDCHAEEYRVFRDGTKLMVKDLPKK